MTTISRVITYARAHHRVIHYDKARELGLSRSAIRNAIRTNRLWSVHRSVLAIEGPLDGYGRILAATLCCDASADALSAAVLHGLRESWPSKPQVIRPGRSGATGPAGVHLRHSTTLTPQDLTYRRGIPTTTMVRTIVDCARRLDPDAVKAMLRQAERQRFDLRKLDRPGTPKTLRAVLGRYVLGSGFSANELEARFLELCAEAGLPLPIAQRPFGDSRAEIYIDFVWPDVGLIVETDGRESHDGFIASSDDRARDRRMFRAGYITLRFTWNDIRYEPEMVKAELIAAHRQLRRAA
jgi:hypothetical protein